MLLVLSVIGEDAHLRVHACGEQGKAGDEVLCDLQVPARSLLLALQAGIEDETGPQERGITAVLGPAPSWARRAPHRAIVQQPVRICWIAVVSASLRVSP
jgi:hypothetical protein